MKPLILLTCLSTASFCQDSPTMQKVEAAMNQAIKAKEIAGSVTVVADKEKTLHFSASGRSDIESNTAMPEDAIFWIASMTKPITGTAIMMMQEAGKLSVTDPVSKYIPEFKDLKDASGKEVVVTIQQCLSHTSGLRNVPREEAGDITNLKDLMPHVVKQAVEFEPGSKWNYCQSSINTAARIVEIVSGESFPNFLENHLFAPLGMKDTTFYPSAAQIKRIATSYARTDTGELEKAELMFLGNQPISSRERYPRANGGLFSTAADYEKFARMILRGGELDGRRYLKEASVKQMTSVQTGDLNTGFTPGNGWGIGWCVTPKPQGVSAALSPGSYGHGGAYGTQVWIDPVKERIYLLMVQRANFPNSDASDVRQAFQAAAN